MFRTTRAQAARLPVGDTNEETAKPVQVSLRLIRFTLLLVALAFSACAGSTRTARTGASDRPPSFGMADQGETTAVMELADLEEGETVKNVILMIPDGFGPASLTMGRAYSALLGRPFTLDRIIVGVTRTAATDSRVTDSAASATAYACGIKSYNGAIAVDTRRRPVATILEAAEARGMATGLVATSRITHATPASFSAHVPDREMESEIAAQQILQDIDVIFGGGLSYFLPTSKGGLRGDNRDLLQEAADLGYQVVTSRTEFDVPLQTPVLGLFSRDHMDFEVDRNPTEQPSLAEMTRTAIDLLKEDDDGFFLMVEGSRIDHAGHANDAVGHVNDILAYDAAVRVALDFAQSDGRTLVVSASDHETGGVTLGRDGQYAWNPEVLRRASRSMEGMRRDLEAGADRQQVVREGTGVRNLRREEQAALDLAFHRKDAALFSRTIRDIVSTRANVGWTTSGHTGVDVNLGAYGPGAARFVGSHENSEVGRMLAGLLGFDLPELTAALRD